MDRDPDVGSPFMQPGFIASGLLLSMVLVTGIVISLGFEDDGRGRPAPVQAPGVAPVAQGATTGGGAAAPGGNPSTTAESQPCPAAEGADQTIPEKQPDDLDWQIYRSLVALPYSKSAGPARSSGGVMRCYAHSPTGALIALAQIDTRYFLSSDWKTVVQHQVYPGPGRDVYVGQRGATFDTNPMAAPGPGKVDQFSGFRFVSYTPASAVIELVRRSSSHGLKSTVHTMVWDSGDWKLQLQSNGADTSITRGISSLAGFVSWGSF
ncbi:hypothetical protein [Embleya sp. NBC_00896]|uniref:hypothetical protein n=1 Tax=Embleya sp. NBC_00896 TaxID=2975961 RepID=UPI00386BA7EB|nr:hypothetical protein OG928_31680 [Embleya sp. NBC_00896]